MYADDFLQRKLDERIQAHALRKLQLPAGLVDFCSNDYLGIARNNLLHQDGSATNAGATGSRLLAGNYAFIMDVEKAIAQFHRVPAALMFNSGYDANLGLLASVPQRGDTVLYDHLSHASIRDGLRLGFAKSYSFAHNDMYDLEKKLQEVATGNIFVVTESVFSMDGDTCPLPELVTLCNRYKAHLIIDEAHATGVIGERGEGLVNQLGLEEQVFARVHTFGKACGCHGAVVLGSERLYSYLVNFARSLIYSTALPEKAVGAIARSYDLFPHMVTERRHLQALIHQFQHAQLRFARLHSYTPIQGVVVPGNEAVRQTAHYLQQQGFDVRPILYPTVPAGSERLRIVLHAFNTEEELRSLLHILS
jgi:8-amino-7-oxononanoate synthase